MDEPAHLYDPHTPKSNTRTRIPRTRCAGTADSAVMHLHTSLVIVSPAEFEAVRARQPELCEGYLIPVVRTPNPEP
eukprot:3772100-Rhodomonas_salina.1